jgi:hypothetical protein
MAKKTVKKKDGAGSPGNGLGQDAPATGEDAPATGGDVPATGEDAPATGEDAPATGEDAPATGEDAPATGEDAGVDTGAPSGQESADPEGVATASLVEEVVAPGFVTPSMACGWLATQED